MLAAWATSFEGRESLRKCPSVILFHLADGIVEGIGDEAGQCSMARPIDGIAKPL
jgi:hypothetical protein